MNTNISNNISSSNPWENSEFVKKFYNTHNSSLTGSLHHQIAVADYNNHKADYCTCCSYDDDEAEFIGERMSNSLDWCDYLDHTYSHDFSLENRDVSDEPECKLKLVMIDEKNVGDHRLHNAIEMRCERLELLIKLYDERRIELENEWREVLETFRMAR